MDKWQELFRILERTRDIVSSWKEESPNPTALRCEQSRHRTLAHLRACQEQWLTIIEEFAGRENPSVTVLHPWRQFDQYHYELVSWADHLAKFMSDREKWLGFEGTLDPDRGGKWNRKPDTIFGLTGRLANHEAYHVALFG